MPSHYKSKSKPKKKMNVVMKLVKHSKSHSKEHKWEERKFITRKKKSDRLKENGKPNTIFVIKNRLRRKLVIDID